MSGDIDNPLTSPTLLASVLAGEQRAWQQFVRIYGPLVLQWCLRSGLQPADAEDVTQDVLLGVSGSLEKFEKRPHDGSFRSWLWSICRNKVNDFHRQNYRVQSGSGGTESLEKMARLPQESPQTQQDVTDLHLRLLAELQLSFSPAVWTAFWRATIEGDSAKDIANDLGISVWGVYKARGRVLAKLKSDWGEELTLKETPETGLDGA